jgi:aminoglycoside 3-N-acetyltransferase
MFFSGLRGRLRAVVKSFLPHLPPALAKRLKAHARDQKLAQHRERKRNDAPVRLAEVDDCLNELSLRGDVLVHASLSSFGKLECTGPQFASWLLQRLDPRQRTVLAPALPFLGSMRDYLEQLDTFDIRTARNAMGGLSREWMKQAEVRRSLHPTHSVIALGAAAAAYCDAHHRAAAPFAPGSPYHELVQRDGQILMLGVGLNSVTNFHVYEDLLGDCLPLQPYLAQRFEVACIDATGQALRVSTPCHDPALSARRDGERARLALQRAGAISSVSLRDSEISVLSARVHTRVLLAMLLDGYSIYGKVRLDERQRAAVERELAKLT